MVYDHLSLPRLSWGMRTCLTCHHLKRPEIDRRLAEGEPLTRLAKDYELTPSSLYRHRVNCLRLGSSNAIKKDAARGSAAAALLPSREILTSSYLELSARIDRIVQQAEQEGSLRVALTGLSSVRQTLDSLARLAAQEKPTEKNKSGQPGNSQAIAQQIAERLIGEFDHEPELKARLAAALLRMDEEASASTAQPNTPTTSTIIAPAPPAAPRTILVPTPPASPSPVAASQTAAGSGSTAHSASMRGPASPQAVPAKLAATANPAVTANLGTSGGRP
jgi:hypothetical protein